VRECNTVEIFNPGICGSKIRNSVSMCHISFLGLLNHFTTNWVLQNSKNYGLSVLETRSLELRYWLGQIFFFSNL
jgi:hypothetical protein